MTDHPEPTRRMTLSQVVELLLNRGSSDHSAVTLTRNARGETQIEVVVRTADIDGMANVHDVAAVAVAVYDELRERYPLLATEPPAAEPKRGKGGSRAGA